MGVVLPTTTIACDIAQVDCANRYDVQRRKLATLLTKYGVVYSSLQNGGNDAVYTLACAMRMMEVEKGRRMTSEGENLFI